MEMSDFVGTARDAFTVRRIFGEPVEAEGVTVIPAAAVRGALGGGSGQDGKGQDGEGGGFMFAGRPVGAFVITAGAVRWEPAVDVTRLVTAAGLVIALYLVTRRSRARSSPAWAGSPCLGA